MRTPGSNQSCALRGRAWFTTDQPSRQLGSFGIPAVAAVGVELDRKPADLLEALRLEAPMALLAS